MDLKERASICWKHEDPIKHSFLEKQNSITQKSDEQIPWQGRFEMETTLRCQR